jgi:hypothetical protein
MNIWSALDAGLLAIFFAWAVAIHLCSEDGSTEPEFDC